MEDSKRYQNLTPAQVEVAKLTEAEQKNEGILVLHAEIEKKILKAQKFINDGGLKTMRSTFEKQCQKSEG